MENFTEQKTTLGLYDPQFEHDACGIGAVVDIEGRKSHQTVDDALSIVERLEHRAGKDAEGKTGDGVGILLQISHKFFSKVAEELNIRLGNEREYGVGMFFFPQNEHLRAQAMKLFEVVTRKEGLEFLAWREVPVDPDAVGQKARDLNVPGRDAKGVHFAVDYLTSVTKSLLDSGFADGRAINAAGKNVLVIGGGDTGNDCQGTALRQGCTDLMALEMMPQPPVERTAANPWPEWPRVLKVDYGQTECIAKFGKDPRVYQTTVKEFLKDEAGNLTGAVINCLKPERDPETGRTSMVPTGKEFTYDCQLAFIAAGFTGCETYTADAFGVELTARGNVADHRFKTNVDKVFVCGDMRRGQSLVVWGLREGRDCAAEVDRCLMGYTNL
jgi:hypothetical protein